MSHPNFKRALCFAVATAGLAACASQSATLPAASQSGMTERVASTSGPPDCKGQHTTSLFSSSAEQTIRKKEGYPCIPEFGGFGGSIGFPAADPAANGILTSSTTNYNKTLPVLAKGKPLFYLQITTNGAASFAAVAPSAKGLESKKLVAGTAYDLYGQIESSGGVQILITALSPCKAMATKGTYGGTIGTLGTLLEKQTLETTATITLEVYPAGKKIVTPC